MALSPAPSTKPVVALILGSVMALEMEIERATETATETVIELAVKGVQLHREVALVALMLKVPVPTVVARVIAVAVPKIGVAIATAIGKLQQCGSSRARTGADLGQHASSDSSRSKRLGLASVGFITTHVQSGTRQQASRKTKKMWMMMILLLVVGDVFTRAFACAHFA